MPDDLTRLSVAQLTTAYRSRELSPVEVTRAFLDRIDQVDGEVHSYITVTGELALEQATAAESRYAADEPVGPLDGVPTSVKDAFHIAGTPAGLGSVVFKDLVSVHDSGVVRRLRKAGAVFLGKTNTAEFGQSATSENLLGPDTGNPWDLTRTPGGSSGGAAASVAARLAAVAVGSDGGGSIRIPAAFCGIYGFKPTIGTVPDEKGFRGMTDFVTAGPMTTTVDDARTLLGVLTDSSPQRARTGRLRIGYCAHPEGRPVDPGVSAGVEKVAQVLAGQGHDVTPVEPPLEGWNDVFGPLVLADEHRERGTLLASNPDQLTPYARAALRAAAVMDPADVQRAETLLPHYRQRIARIFDDVDLLLLPSNATPAFPLGKRPTQIDGTAVDKLWGAFPFAVPFNVAGVPAATVPCGLADGLPVGAQLVGPAGADALILDVSQDVEEALGLDPFVAAARWAPRATAVPAL